MVKGRGREHPQMCPLSRCVICPRRLAGAPLARPCTSSPDLLFHGPCPPQSFPRGTVSGTCLMEVVTLHAVHFWQGWPFTQNRLPTKPEVPRGPCGQLVSDQKLPWPRGGPGPPTCSSLVFPVLSNLMVSCPHRPAAGGSDHTWSPTNRLGPWWSLWPFLAGDSFSAWGPGDPRGRFLSGTSSVQVSEWLLCRASRVWAVILSVV